MVPFLHHVRGHAMRPHLVYYQLVILRSALVVHHTTPPLAKSAPRDAQGASRTHQSGPSSCPAHCRWRSPLGCRGVVCRRQGRTAWAQTRRRPAPPCLATPLRSHSPAWLFIARGLPRGLVT